LKFRDETIWCNSEGMYSALKSRDEPIWCNFEGIYSAPQSRHWTGLCKSEAIYLALKSKGETVLCHFEGILSCSNFHSPRNIFTVLGQHELADVPRSQTAMRIPFGTCQCLLE